jgi:hypothetical protein
MILNEPYDFKILKLINHSQTILNINKYIAIDYVYIKEKEKINLKPFENEYLKLNPVILYGLSDVEKDITPFNHPLINKENKWIALDLRNVVSLTSNKENYEIRNENEYNLAMQRFILSGMWVIGKQSSLYGLKFPHFVFANWLSENLTKKFGLDLNNQIQLRVLALIYYSKLFTNNYSNDDFNKLIVRLKEDILVPKLIEEIYEKISDNQLENIDDFCKACYTVTGNIRLKNLDTNVLINIITNNWLGLNGKELVILSLEHPPTWISLVYAALTQKSFNKSFISNIAEKLNKKGKGDDFLKSLIYLTREYKEK